MTDFNPNKPEWDKSLPGALPEALADAIKPSAKLAVEQEALVDDLAMLTPEQRLDRLDAIHTEAASLANSHGASYMTHEQDFIYGWQRQRDVATASIVEFEKNPEQYAEELIILRGTLATALYKLGMLDDALAVARRIPDVGLVEKIEWIRDALDYPDADLQAHICPRPTAIVEHQGKDVTIELDRRWASEEVMSLKHGALAFVWICSVCGVANATPEIPERQQRYTESMRMQIHAAIHTDEGRKESSRDLNAFDGGQPTGSQAMKWYNHSNSHGVSRMDSILTSRPSGLV